MIRKKGRFKGVKYISDTSRHDKEEESYGQLAEEDAGTITFYHTP